MTERFYCKTKNGAKPPKYIHESIESAVNEAKRLHGLTGESVEILQIIGEVKSVEVPVTRKEMRVFIKPKFQSNEDDLPF